MKKLCLILALFASLSLDAQYVTTFAKNASAHNEGIYYYMPRNVIKIELTIEETEYHIGPYAEFASEMLGITDYIKENKTDINIQNVYIQLFSEADPSTACFVSFDEKNPIPNMILDVDGVIRSVGYDEIPENKFIERNTLVLDNTMTEKPSVSFIEIIDNQEDEDEDEDDEEGKGRAVKKTMTKEEKAKIALSNIDKTRNAMFDLVSGMQEVAYGNTITYMIDNLKTIEYEYVSLFKGKISTSVYKKCFYITPDRNHANANISCGKLDNGETVKILFDTKNAAANIEPLSDDIVNAEQPNKLYYRMPAQTNVTITLGKDIISTKTLAISQFGEYRLVSTKNNKILFNPNTGQVTTVSK